MTMAAREHKERKETDENLVAIPPLHFSVFFVFFRG